MAARLAGEMIVDPASLLAVAESEAPSAVGDRVLWLVAVCFAAVRVDYPSRPDAQTARTVVSKLGDGLYGAVGATFGADALGWLASLVGETAQAVSRIAASRAPLVRVEVGVSLPSSLLAYDLYGDPRRGTELVARNRVGTPFVMPVAFEALAR